MKRILFIFTVKYTNNIVSNFRYVYIVQFFRHGNGRRRLFSAFLFFVSASSSCYAKRKSNDNQQSDAHQTQNRLCLHSLRFVPVLLVISYLQFSCPSFSDSEKRAAEKLLSLLNRIYLKNKIEYDPMFLEIAVRRYNNKFFKKQLSFTSNGAMALYSLMGLCQVERSNLQKIIESARYNRSPEETEKLLVY